MAVTVPTTYTTIPAEQLNGPPMAGPLNTILNNTNWLYVYGYQPPLVSFVPTDAATTLNPTVQYVVGVTPSQDGLLYTFEHRLLQGLHLTIRVEENAGVDPAAGWSDIYPTTIQPDATGQVWRVHTATIAATTQMIRVTYAATGGGSFLPGHCLAYPTPPATALTAAPTQKASGFRPWDSALLGATGGPVNTEMVDRCRRNAISVLRDRTVCVASFVQDMGGRLVFNAPAAGLSDPDQWQTISIGRAIMPGQKMGQFSVRCIADVTGGPTAGLVAVTLGAGVWTQNVTLAATGKVTQVVANVVLPGGLGGFMDVIVRIKRPGATFKTNLRSLVVLWTPGA